MNPWKTEDDFVAWKRSPANAPFMKYMGQYLDYMKTSWASGMVLSEADQGRAQTLGDLIDLQWERDILPFYEEDEDEGSEQDGDTPG
jgi:hypothetical protein|tara:strand:+ start:253 stop:513 length:261 start_codon:yes stop_codon:yes gene_type:complete